MIINIKSYRFYFILISILIILSDQLTKYIINLNHTSLINNDLIFFSIDYVKNYGAAFNILSGSRIFLSTVSTIITLYLIYFILCKKNISNLNLLSYSLILAGTVGNGIDRIIKGYVIDFINLNFIDFPVFNIADISINVGLILIIYGLIKNKK
jgi:signal peptidase II|tara:strand:+ start:30 stop:491 length:462 start_codon:yes stop_codon:yes gene_type:complete